jgi:hypothetical protein
MKETKPSSSSRSLCSVRHNVRSNCHKGSIMHTVVGMDRIKKAMQLEGHIGRDRLVIR